MLADANNRIGFKCCHHEHILGQMCKNGDGVEMLELFRQAIDYGEDVPEPVDVIGIFPVGYKIRCSVCGDVIDWHESGRRRFAARAAFE